MTSNRGVVYQSAWNLEVSEIPYPNLSTYRVADVATAKREIRTYAKQSQIMQAILWNRISMEQIMNPEVIDLEDAPQAYQSFSDGSSKKFVIDPHGMFKGKVKVREKDDAAV